MFKENALTRSPRQIRIANAVFFFVSGFGYTTWASRIPSIQQSLHLNEAQLGAALFALPIGLMATMPVTGRLLSTFSSSRIMLVGAIAFNLMLGLLGFTTLYWEFIVILFSFLAHRAICSTCLSIPNQLGCRLCIKSPSSPPSMVSGVLPD